MAVADGKESECIFCRIAAGEAPCYKIHENRDYLGFLDIFPNTEAFSIIIPKTHCPSDFAVVPAATLDGLMETARELALKITAAYKDVARCAVVIEGMMIDHLHAKVIPLHGTAGGQPGLGEGVTAGGRQYFKTYPGYITTKIMDQMADRDQLARAADKINSANPL